MSELFSYLKAQTRDAHEALEAHYPFNRMLKTRRFEKQDYVHILQVLAAFHSHVKPWLTTLAPAHYTMLHTDAVESALHSDLAQLTQAPAHEAKAFHLSLPDTPSTPRTLAAAYVWMGSSLGGKMIERWLSTSCPDLPAAYYTQMKYVSRNWPLFIQAISTCYPLSDTQLTQTANCASALFAGLRETARRISVAPGLVAD
ncbi:biliverdin-producing heme oxygenase [Alteromonas halophila]|uniref:Heme oxygenase n=1 Tax=Alteromonas halophila TaxID=516698 RepID=A0A918MVM8_9ALTE|nr:biliverdin-producing heme oxygenase [Alteromonas halophila]GGW76517.1 hypothetical protein GCM10007391_06480 [Alteromonas halophila]